MKKLNLADASKSEIKFKPSNFPDGQQQITILQFLKPEEPIQILSRFTSWLDLEKIYCAVASLREMKVKEIHLYLPYLLGARSDRNFGFGQNNYLKHVVCPAINTLNLDSVTILDPHSDCVEMGIKNFVKEDNCKFVKWALTQINNKNDAHEKTVFVSPDAGALRKIYKVAEHVDFKGEILVCSKSRNTEGKIDKVVVPVSSHTEEKDFVIIDDVCDGGMTFLNIAQEIKRIRDNSLISKEEHGKTYLVVTHGIFSKGFDELSKLFDGIFTTNSYGEAVTSNLPTGKTCEQWITRPLQFMPPLIPNGLVKQMKIF